MPGCVVLPGVTFINSYLPQKLQSNLGGNYTTEVEWGGGMDWIDLAQDMDKCSGSCKCGNEPWVSIK
jgi:hypothetical protein